MNKEQRNIIDGLYLSFYDQLISYGISSLGNESLAEEAVQETFAIACAKADSLCASPNSRGWLVNVMKHVIGNMERRRASAEKLVCDYRSVRIESLPTPAPSLKLELLYGNVADSEEFKLMVAISQDGKSLIELAREQGISVSACKKRAQRAREILQKRIK